MKKDEEKTVDSDEMMWEKEIMAVIEGDKILDAQFFPCNKEQETTQKPLERELRGTLYNQIYFE